MKARTQKPQLAPIPVSEKAYKKIIQWRTKMRNSEENTVIEKAHEKVAETKRKLKSSKESKNNQKFDKVKRCLFPDVTEAGRELHEDQLQNEIDKGVTCISNIINSKVWNSYVLQGTTPNKTSTINNLSKPSHVTNTTPAKVSSVELYSSQNDINEEQMSDVSMDDSYQDSNYVPPTSPSSNEDESEVHITEQQFTENNVHKIVGYNTGSKIQKSAVDIVNITSNKTDIPLPHVQQPYYDKEEVHTVPLANGRHTKRHFCLYCKKLYAKLPNHLESMHRNEEAVIRLMSYPKGNLIRKEMLNTIRKEGDFQLNTNRLYNGGQLVVARRPTSEIARDAEHYLPCPECKLYLTKTSLSRHYKRCRGSRNNGDRTLIPSSRTLHGQLHKNASSILRNRIFPYFKNDDVVKLIRFDELAIAYGNELSKRYASSSHHDAMIRNRLRNIGKLLIEAKKMNSAVKEFSTLLSPPFYDTVIASIQKVAGLQPDGQSYRAPATASNLVMTVKAAAEIWKAECVKHEDIKSLKRTNYFMSLFKTVSSTTINKTVIENQIQMQRRKTIKLPTLSDVELFCHFVRNNRKRLLAELCEPNTAFNYSTWKNLAAFTMVSILIFNRRRPGEIERMQLQDYKNIQHVDDTTTAYQSFSDKEKRMASMYTRFQIRGKLNRTVPVLLSRGMKAAVDIIIQYRKQAGLHQSNPYIFGLPGDSSRHKYLRAYELIRQYSSACGAKNPFDLRATQLRKHVATHSLNLDLSENDVQHLADFMGHAKDIHKDIYRQPVYTRDICRVSNILKAAQGHVTDEDDSDDNNQNIEDNADIDFSASTSASREQQEREPLPCQRSRNIPQVAKRKCTKVNTEHHYENREWSDKEKASAAKIFASHLENGELPSYSECQIALTTVPELHNISLPALRIYLSNKLRQPHTPKKIRYAEVALRKRWDTPTKTLLLHAFATHLKNGTLPSLTECRQTIQKYPILQGRTAASIKTAVNNELNRRKARR